MLNQAVAIVTGGAKGLGLSIAEHLLAAKARVIILDNDEATLKTLSTDFITYPIDVTSKMDVSNAIDDIVNRHEKIDILINNAGIIHSKPLFSITNKDDHIHNYEEYKKIVDINMHSVFLMTSFVAAKMILKKTKGNIINMSSICANGNAGQSAYSAAKAGVNALTKTWAKELGAFGIRVNAIAPGFINTSATHAALNPKIVENLISKTPLRKLGEATDVAKLVIATITNNYLTGSILDISGAISL